MTRYLYTAVTLWPISVAIPLRAANRPHAGTDSQSRPVWTNDDLERLHDLGLICIVGPMNEETPKLASPPQPYVKTQHPERYAEQAARLRDELDRRKAQLGGYRQPIEDARRLKTMPGGMNLEDDESGITPESGIGLLPQRGNEAHAELAH